MADSKAKPAAKKVESDTADSAKTVALKSPWGSKVIVPADSVEVYLDANYTK